MIYVIRHGQTKANITRTLRGSAFDDELTETGIAEAKAAAEQLKGIKIDVCYCSPMKRTRQTCKIVYSGKVILTDSLLPRKYQNLVDGGNTTIDLLKTGYWNREKNLPVAGGESVLEIEKRLFDFLDEITRLHKGKNVLLVTHGSVICIIQAYFRGFPKDMEYGNYIVKNCEILKFNKEAV